MDTLCPAPIEERVLKYCAVGIGEMRISNRADEVLVTYFLGSCVALTLYDPKVRVGGMIHCLLPSFKIHPPRGRDNPCMFVDTGVPALLDRLLQQGVKPRNLTAKVAGAASMLNDHKLFRIGERNYAMMRKILWANSIFIAGEDVGGATTRSMYLHLDSGKTLIKSGTQIREL